VPNLPRWHKHQFAAGPCVGPIRSSGPLSRRSRVRTSSNSKIAWRSRARTISRA